jgi:hypothetical protein
LLAPTIGVVTAGDGFRLRQSTAQVSVEPLDVVDRVLQVLHRIGDVARLVLQGAAAKQ